jgi:GT2 family glycosyltransferase
MRPVDIVIPVYSGLESARRCVESALATCGNTPFELLLVNDATPEPELARYLRQVAQQERVTLIEQPYREGYAAAVNRAAGLNRDRDIVVLQSDAEVANDWLDRLVQHAAARGVGVVGTFTNAVGAVTYPLPRAYNPLPEGQTVASLDALFARANAGQSTPLPTVEGPCLYFRRDCLSAVGALDGTPLGSDFGVEIDFCLRAASVGSRTWGTRRSVRAKRRNGRSMRSRHLQSSIPGISTTAGQRWSASRRCRLRDAWTCCGWPNRLGGCWCSCRTRGAAASAAT